MGKMVHYVEQTAETLGALDQAKEGSAYCHTLHHHEDKRMDTHTHVRVQT